MILGTAADISPWHTIPRPADLDELCSNELEPLHFAICVSSQHWAFCKKDDCTGCHAQQDFLCVANAPLLATDNDQFRSDRNGLPFSALTRGFDNWRVLVLLFSYVASGLTTALMVKKLGAVAKSLCVPIYLGGCYFYAVHTGSATHLGFAAGITFCHLWSCRCPIIRFKGFVTFQFSAGVFQ